MKTPTPFQQQQKTTMMTTKSQNLSFTLLLITTLIEVLFAWSQFTPKNCILRNNYVGRSIRIKHGGTTSRTNKLQMGLDIKIRIVGRKNGSEQWLEEAYDMYETRLKPSNINIKTIWHKNNNELIKGTRSDSSKGHSVVLLDPQGKSMTSEIFSERMYQWLDEGGSRISFVVGGAEGLPTELKYGSDLGNKGKFQPNMLSLSEFTFTHQFARTLLAEQIYRASEIRKGSGYHK